jgi:small redox-active disulfide protein 2
MKTLQILGPGCAKCHMLANHTEQAAEALGLDFTIEKITDIGGIIAFGIMATPALVVDGKVVVSGRVPTVDSIKALLA